MIKNLAETIESWIREVVAEVTVDVKSLESKLEDHIALHERDMNRLASMERAIATINSKLPNDLQIDTNAPSNEVMGELKDSISELVDRVDALEEQTKDLKYDSDDHDWRLDTLERDSIDEGYIDHRLNDLIETKLPKAVKDELDITDFKVSIVR